MDFIQFEANGKSQQNEINFSDDDDNDEKTEQDKNFIDDSKQPMEDISFYRTLGPENIDHYNKFQNQTRNPMDTLYENDEIFFGTEDTQPELFAPKNRESVKFDKFQGFEKSVKKFKDTLQNFKNSDNPFFDSILYGVMFKISERKNLEKDKASDVLGKDFYEKLLEIKGDIQLDKTLFGFFDRCFLVNFFERRGKFRFLIKKGIEGRKNKVT